MNTIADIHYFLTFLVFAIKISAKINCCTSNSSSGQATTPLQSQPKQANGEYNNYITQRDNLSFFFLVIMQS